MEWINLICGTGYDAICLKKDWLFNLSTFIMTVIPFINLWTLLIQGVSQKTSTKEKPVNSIIMVADVSRLRHFEAYIVKFLLCYRNFIQTILLRPGGNFNFRTKFSSDAYFWAFWLLRIGWNFVLSSFSCSWCFWDIIYDLFPSNGPKNSPKRVKARDSLLTSW